MTCQKFTCADTLIINAWELAPYFFQNHLSIGKGHAKAFLNRNENMKKNFCMSRTNARYQSDQIAPGVLVYQYTWQLSLSGVFSCSLPWGDRPYIGFG